MSTDKRYYVDLDEAIIDSKTNREFTTWDINGVEDLAELLNDKDQQINELKAENELFKQLNIPIDEIEDTVKDSRGRTKGVYYNDREKDC